MLAKRFCVGTARSPLGTLVLLFVGDAPLVLLVSACICRLLGRKSLPSGTYVYRIFRLESFTRIGYATWNIRDVEQLPIFFSESDLSAFGRRFYLIDTVSTVRENFISARRQTF